VRRQPPKCWGLKVLDCTLADLLRAGDRFDSDCVVGTQFESSQAHHAVSRKQRFPGSLRIAPN
jgi:hypothetical protein